MLVMIYPLSLSPGSSPTVHFACLLTAKHHSPCQAVYGLWAHQTVFCFYSFQRRFPLWNTLFHLVNIGSAYWAFKNLQIYKGFSSVQEKLIIPIGTNTIPYPHLLYCVVAVCLHLLLFLSYELLEDNSEFHFSLYPHGWHITDMFIKWRNKPTNQSSEAAETQNCVIIFPTT